MFILLGCCCLPSIRDDYHVFGGLWFLLFAAYFYDPSPAFSRIQDLSCYEARTYSCILSRAIYRWCSHCCCIIFDVEDGSSLFLHGYGPFLLLTNLCASADVCLCGQLSQLCYMSPCLPRSAFKLFTRLDFVFCHGFVLIILFIIIKYSYSYSIS